MNETDDEADEDFYHWCLCNDVADLIMRKGFYTVMKDVAALVANKMENSYEKD